MWHPPTLAELSPNVCPRFHIHPSCQGSLLHLCSPLFICLKEALLKRRDKRAAEGEGGPPSAGGGGGGRRCSKGKDPHTPSTHTWNEPGPVD